MENQLYIEKNRTSRKSNNIQNQNKENKIFITKNLMIPKKSEMKDSQVKFIIKKRFNEKKEYQKKPSDNFIFNEGRWSEEEHEKFLEGIVLYNINWKKIKTLIGTRSIIQVRSHAQKFFKKIKVCKDESLGIDFTLNTVCNLRDMVNQIKNNHSNYNIINVFKYLTNKSYNLEKSRKKIAESNNNNIVFKSRELNNQSNIINLKEDNPNINDNNFFFNDIELNDIAKMNNQINIFNLFQNLLIMNYNSNIFNSFLRNNLYFSFHDIINNVNKLLFNK